MADDRHNGEGRIDQARIDGPTGTSFVGHEWDGIEELDTPMPRWWLYTFYACIAFALVMVVLYPAIPMLHGSSRGTLGWSSHGELEKEMAAEHDRRAPTMRALAMTPIEALSGNRQLLRTA